MKDKDQRYHRHIVVGQLNIKVGDDMQGETVLNAVLKTNSRDLRAEDLSDAQKALQMVHIDRVRRAGGDPSQMEVLDVVLLNVMYLGHQTDEQFLGSLNKDRPAAEAEKPKLTVVPATPFDDQG